MAKASLRDLRQDERSVLRERVLDVAADIVARDGADALSMRKLAAALDCAPMTLYSYFATKHDILLALAQRSFALLAEKLSKSRLKDPVASLRHAYVELARFGHSHPSEYRTMFLTPEAQPQRRKSEADIYAENPAFALGVDRAKVCVASGALAGDPHAITTILWTNVHGAIAAMLCLPAFPFGKPDLYVGRVIDLTLAAFRAEATAKLA